MHALYNKLLYADRRDMVAQHSLEPPQTNKTEFSLIVSTHFSQHNLVESVKPTIIVLNIYLTKEV